MRKLIVTNIVSLDGYYEGPGGNVMVLPMDHTFDAYNVDRLRAAHTLLLGRRSYELFRGFWPPVADDAGATDDQREISRLDGQIQKVVVSDSLTADDTDPWRDTTRIVPRRDGRRHVRDLKDSRDGQILVFASRTLWNDLMTAGLVDELHLIVGAVVLGGGTPAFVTSPNGSLQLLETRAFEGSSNFLARYAVAAR